MKKSLLETKLKNKDFKILWLVENTSKVSLPEGEERIPLISADMMDLTEKEYVALCEEAKKSGLRAEEMKEIFEDFLADIAKAEHFNDLDLDDLYVMPLAKHKRRLAACCQVLNMGIDFDATFILRNKIASIDNRLRAAEGFEPQEMFEFADSLEQDAKKFCNEHDIDYGRLEKAASGQKYLETYPEDELDVFIILDTVDWLRYWAKKGCGITTNTFFC
jgi:hypothetical protein